MTDNIMKKIKYDNEPQYDEPELYRKYVSEKCNFACVYCTVTESESCGATFNLDHFRPKKLFPKLYSDCSNLRYACPRCNSYKRARWIAETDGCIRDCDSCTSKVCTKDIDRFIDVLNENPEDYIELDQDQIIRPINNSNVGSYSILSLRLNREQLIKLRKTRLYLAEWINQINMMQEELDLRMDSLKEKEERLAKIDKDKIINEKDLCWHNMAECSIKYMQELIIGEKLALNQQLAKIEWIQENARKKDTILAD